jgi:hypothetical protein
LGKDGEAAVSTATVRVGTARKRAPLPTYE